MSCVFLCSLVLLALCASVCAQTCSSSSGSYRYGAFVCPTVTVIDTNNDQQNYATCNNIYGCPGDVLRISGCSGNGGSCVADQYFRLMDSSSSQVAFNDDGPASASCGNCAQITYTVPATATAPCQLYTLREGCYKSFSCSGTAAIFGFSTPVCTACSAGTYSASVTTACTACPIGYSTRNSTTIGTSAAVCTICAAGYSGTSIGGTNASGCTACTKGKYCAAAGNGNVCITCDTKASGCGGSSRGSCILGYQWRTAQGSQCVASSSTTQNDADVPDVRWVPWVGPSVSVFIFVSLFLLYIRQKKQRGAAQALANADAEAERRAAEQRERLAGIEQSQENVRRANRRIAEETQTRTEEAQRDENVRRANRRNAEETQRDGFVQSPVEATLYTPSGRIPSVRMAQAVPANCVPFAQVSRVGSQSFPQPVIAEAFDVHSLDL